MKVAFYREDWLIMIDAVQRDMERFLERLAGAKPPSVHYSPRIWVPATDVYETDEEIVIVVDLAGVKKEEIEILVDHDKVTIRGERRRTVRAGGRTSYYQLEIPTGPFEREIKLPVPVDASETRAYYEDGLLEIVLPKAREARTYHIKIR